MPISIERGPKASPIRAVIYGVAGIGKTSLAAELFPNHKALFIDTEESSSQLDVARTTPKKWSEITAALVELARDRQGFEAVVIDTADWAEHMAAEDLARRTGKKSIEDHGFGKGFTMLGEAMKELLTACDACINAGLHVVLIAHSKVTRVSPPDQTDGFDRYELKLTKQTAPLVKEWSDALLFACFGVEVREGSDGRMKGQSSGLRMIHTVQNAAWDAKNRFGLPEVITYTTTAEAVSALAPMFRPRGAAGRLTPPPAAVVAQSATPAPAAETPAAGITDEQLAKLKLYVAVAVCAPIIERALAHYGNPLDCLTEAQAAKIIARCQEEMNKASGSKATPKAEAPKPAAGPYPWTPSILAWLTEHETTINTYLTSLTMLKPGQTFRDLSPEHADKIQTNPSRIAKKCNIPEPKEGGAK